MRVFALLPVITALAVITQGSGGQRLSNLPTTLTSLRRLSPACVATRSVVPTPRVGAGEFYGVTASSPKDAWAVGALAEVFGDGFLRPLHPLIERWNGSDWRVVESPDVPDYSQLTDVAATSPKDAWAVGAINVYSKKSEPLLEHWNGERWSRVIVPRLWGSLSGVASTSARDAWAVGNEGDGRGPSVTLHWDGARWRRVPSPKRETLLDVASISANDVWAVGGLVAMHWGGRRWESVRLRSPSGDPAEFWGLSSVAALSTNDVWAAGGGELGNTVREPLLYHWNGRRWQRNVPAFDQGELNGIATRPGRDVWAVAWDNPVTVGDGSTILRWDGRTWKAGRGILDRDLWAIAYDKGGHMWAVGSTGNPTEENAPPATPTPLIERYQC